MKKSEEKENSRLVAHGCYVCRCFLGVYSPAEIHHVRRLATSKKRGKSPKIPLCPAHHRTGGPGVAIHEGRQSWEDKFGDEVEIANKLKGDQ